MIPKRQLKSQKRGEQGFAMAMVIFMTTALLLLAMAVAPNIRTDGQREKEKEMIWRGKQYARGVKLYYRKMGRFPTSIDDLTKPKIGSLRFMRQAYKDPMNTQDGSWRFIYVGPAGQLIGSLKPPQPNLQFGQAGPIGTPVSSMGNPPGSLSGPGIATQPGTMQGGMQPGMPPGARPGTQPGTQTGGTGGGTNPANPPATTGAPVSADQGTGSDETVPPLPSGDGTIMGGNIIGVGSKIDKKSIKIYEHAKNYRLFEFIWDPSKDMFGMGQPGMQTGTGLGQPIGQPIGQPPGQNPMNPPQTPPLQQNPQQPQ